jgi:pyruvate kinase
MRRQRRAKIVATLGPASTSPEMIEALFLAGVDVFRLNFSHGTHDEQKERYDAIRAVEAKFDRPIAIMQDLQGPKLRLGTFGGGPVMLPTGQRIRLDLDPTPGDERRICLPHREIFDAITIDTDLLVDDGKVRLRVVSNGADFAETVAITGGMLSNRKGVNVPNAILPIAALTEKDRIDLDFGLKIGVDWVALSFVQRPEDLIEARGIIGAKAGILSKLEKPSAIDFLDEIVDLSDAIMVARGDLGVEMAPEDVPLIQRRIIRASRRAGKPVVVATQMLESMIKSPTPTRAEASDVATAVYDGADAVMLSAETAAGDYPLEAVSIMDRIVAKVETDSQYRVLMEANQVAPEQTTSDAISAAARQIAYTMRAKAIVTYTSRGTTTYRAARERPEAPILCITPTKAIARRMCIVWGVHSCKAKDITNFAEMVGKAVHFAFREEFAKLGESIVITAGVPFGQPGATNVLRIAEITETLARGVHAAEASKDVENDLV